jgi:hypothetical protein
LLYGFLAGLLAGWLDGFVPLLDVLLGLLALLAGWLAGSWLSWLVVWQAGLDSSLSCWACSAFCVWLFNCRFTDMLAGWLGLLDSLSGWLDLMTG